MNSRNRSKPAWFLLTLATLAMPCGQQAVAQPGPSVVIISEDPQPVSNPPTPRTTELIGDLASPSWDKRDQAARELLDTGPDVEAQLQWVLEKEASNVTEDNEHAGPGGDRSGYQPGHHLPRRAYHELVVLVDRLGERRRAVPSTITLRYKDAPITEVLRDFATQRGTGLWIVDYGTRPLDWIRDVRGTIDIERTSYWDTLRAIRREWGFGGMDALLPSERMFKEHALVPDTARSPFDVPGATRAGPLLIAPWSVEAWHKQTASGHDDEGLVLVLRAIAEPKIRAGQHAIVEIDEVSDDQDRSLLGADGRTFYSVHPLTPQEVGTRGGAGANDRWQWEIPVRLASPAAGRRIAVVRGRLGVGVGPPSQTMTLSGISRANGWSLRFDGVLATVLGTRPFSPPDVPFAVSVKISAPAGGPIGRAIEEEGAGPRFVEPRAIDSLGLLDEARHQVRRNVSSFPKPLDPGAEQDSVVGTLTTIDTDREPVTLTWGTPAETRWFKVPFELRDIPIPSSR